MALKIIGSGFGRTGTMTMKDALGILGFGPTHHATEIFENPEQLGLWNNHFDGEAVDWGDVFDGYNSQVDWPGAAVWDHTLAVFPKARLIHTERPEEDWWASFNTTIGKQLRLAHTLPLPPPIIEIATVFKNLLIQHYGDFSDKNVMISAYRENNQKVRDTIPDGQLFVFNVAEGWAPLCAFLNVPTPDTPFPHHNTRNKFWNMFGGEPI